MTEGGLERIKVFLGEGDSEITPWGMRGILIVREVT
jgi:hypothetical protein